MGFVPQPDLLMLVLVTGKNYCRLGRDPLTEAIYRFATDKFIPIPLVVASPGRNPTNARNKPIIFVRPTYI